jgi:predicted DNA-binding antitoxin AbrB/MazE fold protein
MPVIVEAIYESGFFKPKAPIENINEHETVRLIIEPANIIAEQRKNRIRIDAKIAREIGDSDEYSLLEV